MEPQKPDTQPKPEASPSTEPAVTPPQQLLSATPRVAPPATTNPNDWFKSDATKMTADEAPFYKKLIANKLMLPIVIIVATLLLGGTVFGYYALQKQSSKPINEATFSNNEIRSNSSQTTDTAGEPTGAAPEATAPSTTASTTSTTPNPSTSGGSATATPTTNPRKTYTISYTADCYTPNTLSIKAGDTVIFKNNTTNKNMYPATDNHPTHTIYAGFDTGKDIGPGQSFSFTFNRIGAWGFHDHNKPNCDGVITVV